MVFQCCMNFDREVLQTQLYQQIIVILTRLWGISAAHGENIFDWFPGENNISAICQINKKNRNVDKLRAVFSNLFVGSFASFRSHYLFMFTTPYLPNVIGEMYG
jgi:hypothetical protein